MLDVRQQGKVEKSYNERHFLLKSLKRHRIYLLDNVQTYQIAMHLQKYALAL